MKIFVAFLDAEMITLELKSSDTVESLKNMIWENQSIPPHQQFLRIGRHTQLEDGRSLADYNIQNESTITLLLNSLPSIYIYVRTTMGNILPLKVKVSDTIANVKTQIEDTSGVSPEYQIMYYQNQQLQDGWTLTDCNLDADSTIHLFFNHRGGMMILVNYGIDIPIFLEVKRSYTIKKIKFMIWEKLELPTNDQVLLYGGMELEDGRTLADYSIVHESIIEML